MCTLMAVPHSYANNAVLLDSEESIKLTILTVSGLGDEKLQWYC